MLIKTSVKAIRELFDKLIVTKASDKTFLGISVILLGLSSFLYQDALKQAPPVADLLHRAFGIEHTTIYILWGFTALYLLQYYFSEALKENNNAKRRQIKMHFIMGASFLALALTRLLTPLAPEAISEDMFLSNFFIYILGGHTALPVMLVGSIGLANIRPLPDLRKLIPLILILILTSYLAISSGYYYSLDAVGALTLFPFIEEFGEFLTKSKLKEGKR